MTDPFLDAATTWIAANSPRRPGMDPDQRPAHAGIRAPMFAALAEMSNGRSVFSGGLGTGPEFPRLRQQGAHLKELYGVPGRDRDFITEFRQNPLYGCTTVCDMARVTSGFNPADTGPAGTLGAFKDYQLRILSSPLFREEDSGCESVRRSGSDWNDIIWAIANSFSTSSEQDRRRVAECLANLARAAASREGTRQTASLFLQNNLDCADGRIRVYMYYTAVSFVQESGKGWVSRQAEYTIYRNRLAFITDRWPELAEPVGREHFKDVDDWLDNNTSPINPRSPVAPLPCLGSFV